MKIETKYLNEYKALAKGGPKGGLLGDKLLLEIIETDIENKTEGGLIIPESDHARSDFVTLKATVGVVLEVGKGYFDSETGEAIALESKIGSVVWIPEQSIRRLSTVPGRTGVVLDKKIALATEGQVIKMWASIDDYVYDRNLLK